MKHDEILLLLVISGEAHADVLPIEYREQIKSSLNMLNKGVSAPDFDKSRLYKSLLLLPASTVESAAPSHGTFVTSIALKIALIMLTCTLAIAFFISLLSSYNDASVGLRQISKDVWKLNAATIECTSRDVKAVNNVIEMTQGNATIVNGFDVIHETAALRTLCNKVLFSVKGPIRVNIRTVLADKFVGISLYETCSQIGYIKVTLDNRSFYAAPKCEALVEIAPNGTATIVLWEDTTTSLPPLTDGEVLLRLRNGRIICGVVAQLSQQGILLKIDEYDKSRANWIANAVTLRGNDTDEAPLHEPGIHPESILIKEIAEWVPRQTPRGRECISRWLCDLLPIQLKHISRKWQAIAREFDPKHPLAFADTRLIPEEWIYPEVTYKIQMCPDGPALFARPDSSDLGAGWYLDYTGKLHSCRSPSPCTDF